MEQLYNPDQMADEEIKSTFVARQPLLDKLTNLINAQPEGAGVQHVVIIAPRGMGKTTLLLMIKIAVREQGLTPPWVALRFPEELYNVNDLADFWLEVLDSLATEEHSAELTTKTKQIKTKYADSQNLEEAAIALIKSWCNKHKKRLVLLVDNINLVLQLSERDQASLRNVLMNDGFLMIVGASPAYFDEMDDYDNPLYNFFQVEHLRELKFDEILDLLRRRAVVDNCLDFERNLTQNTTRLKVLEYFTGGNPRLVLMLYRVVAQSEVMEVQRSLEKLLDQVTPYYKDKMEVLPPQQRKILDYIARRSSETHEGVTPGEIAKETRIGATAVSSQLKRLADLGYVRAANMRGRNSYYTLSEQLYTLWYQMRFGRNARQRMGWLVNFLKAYYNSEELGSQSILLENQFHELLESGLRDQARNTLEYRRWLVEAMGSSPTSGSSFDSIVRGHLAIKDIDKLKNDILPTKDLHDLSPMTIRTLVAVGCLPRYESANKDIVRNEWERKIKAAGLQELQKALDSNNEPDFAKFYLDLPETDFRFWLLDTFEHNVSGNFEQGLISINEALAITSTVELVWETKVDTLKNLKRFQEALDCVNIALTYFDNPELLLQKGWLFGRANMWEEAVSYFDKAIELEPSLTRAWLLRGTAMAELLRYNDAISSLNQALSLEPANALILERRGSANFALENYQAAIDDFDLAVQLDDKMANAWSRRGQALEKLSKPMEAIESYEQALKTIPGHVNSLFHKGWILIKSNRFAEAKIAFERILNTPIADIENALPIGVETNYYYEFAHLSLLVIYFQQQDVQAAKLEWQKLTNTPDLSGPIVESASQVLILMASDPNNVNFVHDLIRSTNTENVFFPLQRAIEFTRSGDQALIEKLSPEMRPIVEELVIKLRPVADKDIAKNQQRKIAKPKPKTRKSTVKRLT